MTKDDIINRMQEAGLKAPARGDFIFIHWDQIALLLAHEIEACANLGKELLLPETFFETTYEHDAHKDALLAYRNAIRARSGEQK